MDIILGGFRALLKAFEPENPKPNHGFGVERFFLRAERVRA